MWVSIFQVGLLLGDACALGSKLHITGCCNCLKFILILILLYCLRPVLVAQARAEPILYLFLGWLVCTNRFLYSSFVFLMIVGVGVRYALGTTQVPSRDCWSPSIALRTAFCDVVGGDLPFWASYWGRCCVGSRRLSSDCFIRSEFTLLIVMMRCLL